MYYLFSYMQDNQVFKYDADKEKYLNI